eukprot:COSAG05_NODE_3821_length_1820_cov_1.270773_3_plen_70_part_01
MVKTPGGLPDAAQLTRPTPSLVAVTFVGPAVISVISPKRRGWLMSVGSAIPRGNPLGPRLSVLDTSYDM